MGTQTHLGDLTHRLIKAEGSLSYACRSLYACSMLTVLRLQSASLQRLFFPWAVPTWAKVWARCVSTCTLYYLTTGISTLSFPETSVKLIFSTPTTAKVLSERLANEANEGRKSRPIRNSLPSLNPRRMLLLLVLGFGDQKEMGALNSSNMDHIY